MDDVDELMDALVRAYTVFGVDPVADADELGIGKWLEELHPRDKLGQWRDVIARLIGKDREKRAEIGADITKDLMDRLKEGGFTYSLPKGNYPKRGHSVAVAGFGREFENIDDVTPDDIRQYASDNIRELRKDPTRHLGAWLEGKKAFLDIAEVVDDTLEEGLERARARGEIALYDLGAPEGTDGTRYVPYYRDHPPPPGSPAANALALPEGHENKVQWAGDITPRKRK